MAKHKATIAVDRERVEEVRRLTGAPSTSAAIDLALRALIRAERLRHDVAAYGVAGATENEVAVARATPDWADLADDTDWDAAYPQDDLDKRRPVAVLTSDPLGRYLQAVLVGPVTSTIRGLSTEVDVGAEDGVSTSPPCSLSLSRVGAPLRANRNARGFGSAPTLFVTGARRSPGGVQPPRPRRAVA